MRFRLFACRLLVTISVLVTLCSQSHAAMADAATLVTDFSNQARQILKDKDLTEADRERRVHELVNRSFDVPAIARVVLGHYWQTTSDGMRQEFASVFEDYAIAGYTRGLEKYGSQPVAVTAERAESEHITIVATSFPDADGDESTAVDWRVETTANGFKIIDIGVSGVSMAASFRDQFVTVIERDGGQVAGLIAELRGKVAKSGEPTSAQR